MTKKLILSTIILTLSLIIISGCGGGGGGNTNPEPATCNIKGTLGADILSTAGSGTIKFSAPSSTFGRAIETTINTSGSGDFTLNSVRTSAQTLTLTMPNSKKYTYAFNIPQASSNMQDLGAISKSSLVEVIKSEWAIYIYMAADNNLLSNATADLNEMVDATVNNNNLQIIAFLDGQSSGTYIYRIKNGIRETLYTINKLDSGNANTARDFFDIALKLAPANRYIVNIWNHGNGWDTEFDTQSISRSIANDSTSNTAISVVDLPYAISPVAEASGGGKIDIVITDACLMGCIEMICEIDNSAKYFIASPDQTPVSGIQYDDFLTSISQNASNSTKDLAQKMLPIFDNSIYIANWKPMAALYDLSQAQNFASALNNHILTNPSKRLGSTYNYNSPTPNGVYRFNVPGSCSMYDLMEFVGADSTVKAALDTLVIKYSSHNTLYPLRTLGAYFPATNSWNSSAYTAYGWLKFRAYAPSWYSFLNAPRDL